MGSIKTAKGKAIRKAGEKILGTPKGKTINLEILDEVTSMPPSANVAGPKTPAEVLEELQTQLAERNLPEAEVERLLENPLAFLRDRTGTGHAEAIIATVAKLYFATLHRKAVDGEAFTEGRLKQALIEARIRTLEALAQGVQHMGPEYVLKVAELVSKD